MDNNFSEWRVLIVDDEPDNLNLLADMLEFRGATVYRAATGEIGMEAVDSFHPNIILLDLSMPGLDGWEAHRQLRARTEFSKIPIIAVTALAMATDAERVSKEGFTGYITKPFRMQALFDELVAYVTPFLNQSGA
jgi:two-component system, cell cycle response regulator DivK